MNRINSIRKLFVFLSLMWGVPLMLFGRTISEPEQYTLISGPALSQVSQLSPVPFADESEIGIVSGVVTLPIPGFKDAYNPSMIKTDSGFLVAYRFDLPWNRVSFKKARIGLLELDDQFRPLGKATLLATRDEQVEDPRLFTDGQNIYVSYTHLTFWGPQYLCCIGLSQINRETHEVGDSWDLRYKTGPREKNWSPFFYDNNGTPEMYFVYSWSPLQYIKAASPLDGTIEQALPIDNTMKKGLAAWEKKWGKIRGGTPAIRIGEEYISFFHSSFRELSYYWYIMGAMVFDAHPPFALKRISKFPILFNNIFTTPLAPSRNQFLRAIFPGGVVEDVQNDRPVFHVIVGENDTGIKIVTIDRENLFKHMTPAD